jgi:hypothetical protein
MTGRFVFRKKKRTNCSLFLHIVYYCRNMMKWNELFNICLYINKYKIFERDWVGGLFKMAFFFCFEFSILFCLESVRKINWLIYVIIYTLKMKWNDFKWLWFYFIWTFFFFIVKNWPFKVEYCNWNTQT